MFTMTISLDALSMYIVAADIIVLFSYILYILHKRRKLEGAIRDITDFITEYFMNTGAEVQVTCCKLDGSRRFVVMIESEPLKRFRYSNVLELNLIAHVHKVTGSIVDKIYWRFPVPIQKGAMIAEGQASQVVEDVYFSDVRAIAGTDEEYRVSEVSWDEYETSKKSLDDI